MTPSTAVFPDIDIAKLTRDLKLVERGIDAGKHNLPIPDAENLDATEHEIVSEVDRIRRTGLNNYSGALEAYSRRIESVPNEVNSALLLTQEIETNYLKITRENSNDLENYKEDVQANRQEFEAFRKEHKRRGVPKRKDTAFYFWSLVAFIAVAEIILNGMFFALENKRGYLGGVSIACGIAIINLMASYFSGKIATRKNHINMGTRIPGYIFLVGFMVFVVGFSLAVGHFREAYTGDFTLASNLALETLLNHTMRLQGLDSWALVLLTAMISLIMFWKGYTQYDPYPGYYDVWERMQDARSEYSTQVAEAHDELEEARDEAIGKLENQRNSFKATIDDSRSALSAQAELPHQLEAFLSHTTQAVNNLLSVYRDENNKHRSAKSPKTFDKAHAFPESTVGGRALSDRATIDTEAVEKVNNAYRDTIHSIGRHYSESIEGFTTIRELNA